MPFGGCVDAGSAVDELAVTVGPGVAGKPSVSASAEVGSDVDELVSDAGSVVDALAVDAGSVVDEVPVGPGAGGEPSVGAGAGVGSIIDKLA